MLGCSVAAPGGLRDRRGSHDFDGSATYCLRTTAGDQHPYTKSWVNSDYRLRSTDRFKQPSTHARRRSYRSSSDRAENPIDLRAQVPLKTAVSLGFGQPRSSDIPRSVATGTPGHIGHESLKRRSP